MMRTNRGCLLHTETASHRNPSRRRANFSLPDILSLNIQTKRCSKMHHNARLSVSALIRPKAAHRPQEKAKAAMRALAKRKIETTVMVREGEGEGARMRVPAAAVGPVRTGAPPLHQLSTALQRSLTLSLLSLSLSVCLLSVPLTPSLSLSLSACLSVCLSLFLPPCLSRPPHFSFFLSLVCVRRVTSLRPSADDVSI